VAPKSKKGTREVGIPKLLIPHLAAQRLATGRTDGLVFGPTGKVPLNATKLHERAYKAWEAAGLTRITLHESATPTPAT
jgi:hypothetical protein